MRRSVGYRGAPLIRTQLGQLGHEQLINILPPFQIENAAILFCLITPC